MVIVTKELVLQAEENLLISIKESDVQRLDALLHDDLIFVLPRGAIITKTFDLQAYRSGNMKITEIKGSDYIVNIIDNTAVVSVRIWLKGEAFGQALEGEFQYMRIWKLFDYTLKVIAGSCIKLEA